MDSLKVINLAIRLLLEICALIAVGYWGFKTGSGWLLKILFGIGAPILIAVLWGMFGAPKSVYPFQGLAFLGLEFIVYGSGVLALFLTGSNSLAWIFALLLIVNKIFLVIWKQ
jgi:hypothetical protein